MNVLFSYLVLIILAVILFSVARWGRRWFNRF